MYYQTRMTALMRFLKLWPGVMSATIPPYACMVYNRPLLPVSHCVSWEDQIASVANILLLFRRVLRSEYFYCALRLSSGSVRFHFCSILISPRLHMCMSLERAATYETLPRSYFGHEVTRQFNTWLSIFLSILREAEQWGTKATVNLVVSPSCSDFKELRKRENKPPPMCYTTLSNLVQTTGWHVSRAWHLRSSVLLFFLAGSRLKVNPLGFRPNFSFR